MRSLLLAAALLLVPAWAFALPPVWVVHDKDSTLVLFGSVHLLPQDVRWKPPQLDQALAAADDVWFEAAMGPEGRADAVAAAQAHALLPEGQSLSALLSPKGRVRLAKAAQEAGYSMDQMNRLQPWYADVLVSATTYQKLGAQGESGVEQQLWGALNPKAERRTFETPAQQISFFADAPLKVQLASLEETLRQAGDAKREFEVLLKAWLAGDVKRLDKEAVEPLKKASPELYDIVVRQRNARWVQALDGRLKGSGHTVVIVGMGHLVGPDGQRAALSFSSLPAPRPRPA
jgi:uncharacterized protein YbaP (TraB family)